MKLCITALDAMRKAYEEELEQEKEKYRHALKTMFTDMFPCYMAVLFYD